MLYAIRQIFLKGGDIKDAINYIFKTTGKMPTKAEGKKITNMYQNIQKDTAKIFKFPKDRITPFNKPRPGDTLESTKKRIFKIDDELEKLSAREGKYAKMSRNDREDLMIRLQDESSDLQKVPGMAEDSFKDEFKTFQLNVAKNNPEFNQNLAKQVINREIFKDATTEQRKQVLDTLESAIKNPEDIEPFASGGRVSLSNGGLANILGV